MRAKWDEKAKRLAKENNMVDEIERSLWDAGCLQKGNCSGIGVETADGRRIRWSLNGDIIEAEVRLHGRDATN
jgi:hypothetical protein